jgi:hypothetical protein
MALLTILHITILASLSFFMWKKQTSLKKFFWPALAVKLFAGVCLGLIYTYYYSVADTFVYFNDGSKLASVAREDLSSYVSFLFFNTDSGIGEFPLHEPRALFLIKITSVFNILTADNYWVTGFYYSFCSFAAAWFLVRTIYRHIPDARNAAVIAFLFLPSVIFWSSGLLKESLALAALYFLTAIFLEIWFEGRPSFGQFVLAAIAVWIFWNLKYYYAAVFFPVVFTTLLYKYVAGKRLISSPASGLFVWFAMLVFPVLLVMLSHPNFRHDRLLQVILENNTAYTSLSPPENVIHFNELGPDPFSFLKNSPRALFSGLFRPLFWETSAIIQVLPAIENTVILLLFLGACFRYKAYLSSRHRTLLLAATAYVVFLSVLITFAAPNFGTLSRYRTGYISFFVLVILCNNPLSKYVETSFRRLVSH